MPLRTLRSHPSPLYRLPGKALVLIACALAVLLTTALLAVFAWRDRAATVERVATVATTAGMLVAEHAARLVETSDLILRRAMEMAGPPGAPLPADRATWERLGELARATPYVTAIWLGDAEGNAVLTTHDFPTPRLSAADRDYFQAHKAGGPGAGEEGLFVGRLDSSRYDNAPAVVLSRALRNADGGLRGFATVTVSQRYFRELYRGIDIGFPATVSLMRADGTVLVREPPDGSEGADGGGGAADGKAVTAQRAIDRFGLRTEVSIGHDAVLLPWRGRLDTYVSYGVLALLIVAGMGALAMQRARREREAEDALQRAYDTLEERVHQRTAELQDANARLEGAVADKEILLKEVQHRVKNNLTVICSLLRLQAGRLDERARFAFDESLRRIQSMSLVHELLYRSPEPARINFADYLRQLSDSLLRAAGASPVRVVVEADDWIVDVDRAMPLALIASELISNALRHAFPDGHAGTVRIALHPDGDGVTINGVTMAVSDDGIGLPADLPAPANARRRGGLGLMLVQSLANQAHAALHIDRVGGTTFTLTLSTAERRSSKAA